MATTATRAAYGDKTNMVQQAVGLFAMNMQRNSTFGHLTGKMPTSSDAANTIKKQTSTAYPIVRCQDLSKHKGDEVTFNLINPVNAKPIMGSEFAEGRGVGMSIAQAKLRVNQARFPIDMGDVMTEIRSPVDFRAMGRPVAESLMNRYVDQSILVHLAGARGFHNDGTWVVPTEKDPEFKKIMVNPVFAPSKNRHFMMGADGVAAFGVNAGDEVNIASDDLFNMDTIDTMKSVLDTMALPPPIIKLDGDVMSEDAPIRVWMVSADQYNKFAADPAFRQFQAAAYARASQAKQHPLFMGEVGIWNGFVIKKMPKPIRFYAGDEIRYSDTFTSQHESVATVPAAFAGKFAIDRSIILGGQAAIEALASAHGSGIPFFWSEKELDHGDKVELLIGAIRGVSKTRFDVDTGMGQEITDYGVTVVDTVVPLHGLR